MTTAVICCGALVGAGLFLFGYALIPLHVDPAVALATYDAARAAAKSPSTGIKAAVGGLLLAKGYPTRNVESDLAVCGESTESFLAAKVFLALIGLVLPTMFVMLWSLVGIRLPVEVPAVLSLSGAAGAFFLPDVALRRKAGAARTELRRTLSSYLDLVAMGLGGGRGLAEALSVAARVGDAWAFRLLADTAESARPRGVTPWHALGELGERLRVPELVDLGAAFTLAGTEGARVKSSLAARATTLRGRMLADETGQAAADDQSMGIAQVILGLGFLLFITYPAVFDVIASR